MKSKLDQLMESAQAKSTLGIELEKQGNYAEAARLYEETASLWEEISLLKKGELHEFYVSLSDYWKTTGKVMKQRVQEEEMRQKQVQVQTSEPHKAKPIELRRDLDQKLSLPVIQRNSRLGARTSLRNFQSLAEPLGKQIQLMISTPTFKFNELSSPSRQEQQLIDKSTLLDKTAMKGAKGKTI